MVSWTASFRVSSRFGGESAASSPAASMAGPAGLDRDRAEPKPGSSGANVTAMQDPETPAARDAPRLDARRAAPLRRHRPRRRGHILRNFRHRADRARSTAPSQIRAVIGSCSPPDRPEHLPFRLTWRRANALRLPCPLQPDLNALLLPPAGSGGPRWSGAAPCASMRHGATARARGSSPGPTPARRRCAAVIAITRRF